MQKSYQGNTVASLRWSFFLAILPGAFLGIYITFYYITNNPKILVLLGLIGASVIVCTLIIFYIRKFLIRKTKPALDKIGVSLPVYEYGIKFIPNVDGRTYRDKVRAIYLAIGINSISGIVIICGFYFLRGNVDLENYFFFITGLIIIGLNIIFCFPSAMFLSEDETHFIIRYDNKLKKKPLSGKRYLLRRGHLHPYVLNIVSAVAIVATFYMVFLERDIFLVFFIFESIAVIAVFLFVKYIVPNARLSKIEDWIISLPNAQLKFNNYYTRDFIVTFFDVIFWTLVFGFWTIISKLFF